MRSIRPMMLIAALVAAYIRVSAGSITVEDAFSVRFIHKKASTSTVVMTEVRMDVSRGISYTESHNVATNAIVSVAHVVDAKLSEVPGVPGPAIEVTLSDAGRKLLANATTTAAGGNLAIIMDGKVKSSPRVLGPIRNGKLFIFPFEAKEEAQQAIRKMLQSRPK